MSFFLKKKRGESAIGKAGKELSDQLMLLSPIEKQHAIDCVGHILQGVAAMEKLPGEVMNILFATMILIGRKTVMGADAGEMLREFGAAMDDEVQAMFGDSSGGVL